MYFFFFFQRFLYDIGHIDTWIIYLALYFMIINVEYTEDFISRYWQVKYFITFGSTSGMIKNASLDEWMVVLLSTSNLHQYCIWQLHSQPPTQLIVAKSSNCPDRGEWRACHQLKMFKHTHKSPLIWRSITLIISFKFHWITTKSARMTVIMFTHMSAETKFRVFFSSL